jgi:SMODS and SLOG-associating 2TM effector domain
MLGGASTLVASYLARTKGTNEPQASKYRAKALDHFLREIESFDLDHGHEMGDKWDEKIIGFRLGLESILGNHPGSVTVNAEGTNSNREKPGKWGAGFDPSGGPSGNGNG